MDAVAGTVQAGERGIGMSKRLRCKDCENSEKYSYEEPCSTCYGYENFKEKKFMSNGDKIRAMSDEELAEWLHNITQFDGYDGELMISIYNLDSQKDEEIRDSYGDLLEWLKSTIE